MQCRQKALCQVATGSETAKAANEWVASARII